MNKLLKMLKDTRVDMCIFVNEFGIINAEFKKNEWHCRKAFDPETCFLSEITIEDQIIFALNDFLESLDKKQRDPVELAYELLVATYNTKDVDKEAAIIAIEEAIGYLGEALE